MFLESQTETRPAGGSTAASAKCRHFIDHAKRRFVPTADQVQCIKLFAYSITSAARATTVGGTVMLSAFAVVSVSQPGDQPASLHVKSCRHNRRPGGTGPGSSVRKT